MSLMCLFPWLDYGIDIVDFENFDFLVGQPIFTSVRAGQNGLFRNNEVSIIKFSKMAETSNFFDRKITKPMWTPPLFTVLRDMVPAYPKYISGKLRSFSKNFSKNFFHTALFENFLPNNVSVVDVQNQPAQWLGTPQNGPWAKKTIFSKSEISSPQSNHGKRNIKLMLVRPQKRFRTTCGVSEIIAKIWIFALQLHVSARIAAETCSGRAKIQILAIIS